MSHNTVLYTCGNVLTPESPQLLVWSTLKHHLPPAQWGANPIKFQDILSDDEALKWDVEFHLEYFNMPAWTRLMDTLAKDGYDSLWYAFDYLMAGEVTNAETDDAMTMNNMIDGFRRLVREAITWKNREALESKRPIAEWAHEDLQIQRLREQDYWAFRERIGAKTSVSRF